MPGEGVAESDPEIIRDKLERRVGLIIHGGYLSEQPTTVIDLSEDEMQILRQGSGDISHFV